MKTQGSSQVNWRSTPFFIQRSLEFIASPNYGQLLTQLAAPPLPLQSKLHISRAQLPRAWTAKCQYPKSWECQVIELVGHGIDEIPWNPIDRHFQTWDVLVPGNVGRSMFWANMNPIQNHHGDLFEVFHIQGRNLSFSGWYTYPSEKWWSERQLGWWHSQYDGKNKSHVPNH